MNIDSHLLFVLLAGAFWLISSISKGLKKNQPKNLPPGLPRQAPMPRPQNRMPQKPVRPKPIPAMRRPMRSPRPIFSQTPAAPQPPPAPPVFLPVTVEAAPVSSAPGQGVASVAANSQGVMAGPIHSWLTIDKLRSQYILTEIFQPPLALREPH